MMLSAIKFIKVKNYKVALSEKEEKKKVALCPFLSESPSSEVSSAAHVHLRRKAHLAKALEVEGLRHA